MRRYTTIAALVLGLAATGFAGNSLAHDYEVGALAIDHPWARATASSQGNGAAYLTVTNNGAADRILGAQSPVASRVELHTHGMDDAGVMRMRQVEAVDLPAGEVTELKPGGLHIMLIGLAAPLAEGETFPLSLVLEDGGTIELEVQVEPVTYGIGGDSGMSHGQPH
jgi:periplasmic copper chaperone A